LRIRVCRPFPPGWLRRRSHGLQPARVERRRCLRVPQHVERARTHRTQPKRGHLDNPRGQPSRRSSQRSGEEACHLYGDPLHLRSACDLRRRLSPPEEELEVIYTWPFTIEAPTDLELLEKVFSHEEKPPSLKLEPLAAVFLPARKDAILDGGFFVSG